jgi:hypothetical protein
MAQDGKDRWLTLASSSSGGLQRSASNASGTCEPELAAALATQLFGCFRASEASDPSVFVTAAAAVLAHYPEAVARKVCHPVGGLPSRSQWGLPSIWEIGQACEREMAPIRDAQRRERECREREAALAPAQGKRVGREAWERLRGRLPLAPARDAFPGRRLVEGQDAFADRGPPTVNTAEMAAYLNAMKEGAR